MWRSMLWYTHKCWIAMSLSVKVNVGGWVCYLQYGWFGYYCGNGIGRETSCGRSCCIEGLSLGADFEVRFNTGLLGINESRPI